MLNRSFHVAEKTEKTAKLKKALKSKNPNLTSEQLSKIIKHVDIEKQHYIKFTKKISKFQNIITDEFISTESKQLISRTIHIYGFFKIGLYKNVCGMISHHKSEADPLSPSAAIKVIDDSKKTTMMIVMYHP